MITPPFLSKNKTIGIISTARKINKKELEPAILFFKENNFRIIDDEPRQGSRGTTVFFIHPKSHNVSPLGILYEVVEDQRDVF